MLYANEADAFPLLYIDTVILINCFTYCIRRGAVRFYPKGPSSCLVEVRLLSYIELGFFALLIL